MKTRLARLFDVVCALLFLSTVRVNAVTISETFSSNATNGSWRVFGNTNLFQWNPTNQNLEVTWDSSKVNSYFYCPLGTIVARDDDFSVSFDIRLQNAASGTTPGKPYDMPLAIGFMNFGNATNANYSRGSGVNSTYGVKSLVEFDYFPAFSIYEPTLSQVIVSTNNSSWLYNHDNLQEMTAGDLFHIAMSYSSATRKLTTVVTRNGTQYGATQFISVTSTIDFRCDTFSISSYSDQNSAGSIYAQGTIDNIAITVPPSPVQNLRGYFTNAQWSAEFNSNTNWTYLLERAGNFQNWTETSAKTNGTGSKIILADTNAPGATTPQFYRVKAIRK